MLEGEPPPSAAHSELVCFDRLRAEGLRGARDWQVGGESSLRMLSVYTGADVGPGWATRLLEVAVESGEHHVYNAAAGERLQIEINRTSCFAREVFSTQEAPTFCFQIADVTNYGGHVRSVNRGCGAISRVDTRHTLMLNDGAHITLDVSFGEIGGGLLDRMTLAIALPLAGVLVLGLLALLMRRSGRQRGGGGCCDLRAALYLCCGKVMGIMGFSALEAVLSRNATRDYRHSPLAGRPPKSKSKASRSSTRKVRAIVGHAEIIPPDSGLGEISVHEINLTPERKSFAGPADDGEGGELGGDVQAIHEQEAAVKRAMELLRSAGELEAQPAQTAAAQPPQTLLPPPPAASPPKLPPPVAAPAGPVAPVEPPSQLLADISSILAMSSCLSPSARDEAIGGENMSDVGALSADLATVGTLPKELGEGYTDKSRPREAYEYGMGSEVSLSSIFRRGPPEEGEVVQTAQHHEPRTRPPRNVVRRAGPKSLDD